MTQKQVKARRFDRTIIIAPIERISDSGWITLPVLREFLAECGLFGVPDDATVQVHWRRDPDYGGAGIEVVVDEKRPRLAPPERATPPLTELYDVASGIDPGAIPANRIGRPIRDNPQA